MGKIISWVEIPALDLERAVKFYNAVLELELKVSDFGEEKMACFPKMEGAISYSPGFKPSKEGVLVSFNASDDISSALERVVANGGEIVKGETKIDTEGFGSFALFIDSEGNKVGLYGSKES